MNSLLYKNRIKIIEVFILIFITTIFRLPTFFLAHNNNDELIYLSLAMKMDRYGFDVFREKQYNLYYVDAGFIPQVQLIGLFEGKNKEGSLLKGFLGEREDLSHHPPGLPFFIAASHKIFASKLGFLASLSRNINTSAAYKHQPLARGNEKPLSINPEQTLDFSPGFVEWVNLMIENVRFQFYVCFIPFLFSLLLILATYFLGSMFFSHHVGLLSALFLSFTPVELLTSNKIWADDMTAFFVVLSIILYLHALKNNRPVFALLGGLSCGASILTKMSGIYIVIAILVFHIFKNINKKINFKTCRELLFDRDILYFLAGVFIISAWWFDLYLSQSSVIAHKGFFAVNEKWDAVKTWNSYFKVASNRPWYSYFLLVPFQFPLYLLSYIFIPILILKNKIKSIGSLIRSEYRYLQFLIFWMMVVFMFLTLKPGKEERYMLIAYPAISILSTYCFNLFYGWMKNRKLGLSLNLQRVFFVSIILLSIFFSLKIAIPRVLLRADIIPIPL